MPSRPGPAVLCIHELLRKHPGAVMQVLLFRDRELLYHRLYDPRAGEVLHSDLSRVYAAVHGVHDFMQDSLGGQGKDASYVIGKWRITGLVEGACTLVAVTQTDADRGRIAGWLQNLALKLPRAAV